MRPRPSRLCVLALLLGGCSAEHARMDADTVCVHALDPEEAVTRIEVQLFARCLGTTVIVDVAECTVSVEGEVMRVETSVEWTTGYPSRGKCGGSFEIDCEVPAQIEAGTYRVVYGDGEAEFDTADGPETTCVDG